PVYAGFQRRHHQQHRSRQLELHAPFVRRGLPLTSRSLQLQRLLRGDDPVAAEGWCSMPPSLNLTPERGPSVWARMDRESRLDRWWLAMIVGGGVLAAASIRRPASR